MDLERFFQIEVSRKKLVEVGVKAITIAWIDTETDQQAGRIPWSNPRWWPLALTTARRYGIPRLHDPDGPLDIYDRETGSHSREFEIALVNDILHPDRNNPEHDFLVEFADENPGMESWLGHCDVTAALGMLFPQPVGSRRFNQVTKEGILVAATKGNMAALGIPRSSVPEAAQKKGAVVDLFGAGRWFRAAYDYNPNTKLITITNFGSGSREIRVSDIRWSHVPYLDIDGNKPARQEYLTPLAYLKNKEVDLKTALEIVFSM